MFCWKSFLQIKKEYIYIYIYIYTIILYINRLCGLVVRALGYRSRGPGSIPAATRLSGLEQGPLSLVSTTEELLERKSSGSGLGNLDYGYSGSAALTMRHTPIRKCWH
jgi:hypothetical protein